MRSLQRVRSAGRRAVTRFVSGGSQSGTPTGGFYAQQGTCQILTLWYQFEQFLGKRNDGVFVEVGAYDGIYASNTWGLAEAGWQGWLLEPVPEFARKCQANHRHHPRVHVVQTAIGSAHESSLDLRISGTLTTANPDLAREYEGVAWAAPSMSSRVLSCPSTTLDQFLIEHGVPDDFDVLVVDVEGYESSVFTSFDLKRWTPKMMIVELADTHPDLTTTAREDAALGRYLSGSGYRVTYKDSINTVLVRDDVWARSFGLEHRQQ